MAEPLHFGLAGGKVPAKKETGMKLLRFGPKGAEKPGLLDGAGRVRDLSAHIDDVGGRRLRRKALSD
jgi:hypothetical protein